MRVIRFPSDEPLPGEREWLQDLDAALSGRTQGQQAQSWRQMSEDVRSLAPEMDAELERALRERLAGCGALSASGAAPAAARSGDARGRLRRLARGLTARRRPALAGALASAVIVIAALLLAGPAPTPTHTATVAHPGAVASAPAVSSSAGAAAGESSSAAGTKAPTTHGQDEAAAPSSPAAAPAPAEQAAPVSGAAAPAGAAAQGREQQLAASITLGATPEQVQGVSDQVGALAAHDGGYVQSSNVQVQSGGGGEATLSLRVPSARLGQLLSAIARLAPVRAENQSLQDITDSYDSARQRLSDAVAERRALLRALAAAGTEGQIDSLRERLASARAAIVSAQNAFNAIAQRAGTAEVEVSVLGDAAPSAEGLTVHRALHDAGRVLLATLTALLIAAAVLVPLGLVGAALLASRRALLRRRREHALDAR